MSDPVAVSILSKLTSWWDCNGNLTDAHGANDIVSGLSIAGYEAGLNGQRLKAGSRGYCTLTAPGTVNASTKLAIGGRFTYVGVSSTSGCISLSDGLGAHNEVLVINVNALLSLWGASSWASDPTNYAANAETAVPVAYPITVQVTDSLGSTATSNQVVSIATPGGITAGLSYDVVALWNDDDTLEIVVDGVSRGTSALPRPAFTKTQVLYFQTGNQYTSADSPCAHEGLFACVGEALTVAECAWIYNSGARRTYADIVAAAA